MEANESRHHALILFMSQLFLLIQIVYIIESVIDIHYMIQMVVYLFVCGLHTCDAPCGSGLGTPALVHYDAEPKQMHCTIFALHLGALNCPNPILTAEPSVKHFLLSVQHFDALSPAIIFVPSLFAYKDFIASVIRCPESTLTVASLLLSYSLRNQIAYQRKCGLFQSSAKLSMASTTTARAASHATSSLTSSG